MTESFNVLIQYIRTFSYSPQRAERIAADNIRATIAVVINPRINQWRRIRPTFFPFAQFNCFSLFPDINQPTIVESILQVSQKELQDQTVKFTVIDNGRLRKRQVIGHLLCSLKNISIEDGKQVKITAVVPFATYAHINRAVLSFLQTSLLLPLCIRPSSPSLPVRCQIISGPKQQRSHNKYSKKREEKERELDLDVRRIDLFYATKAGLL